MAILKIVIYSLIMKFVVNPIIVTLTEMIGMENMIFLTAAAAVIGLTGWGISKFNSMMTGIMSSIDFNTILSLTGCVINSLQGYIKSEFVALAQEAQQFQSKHEELYDAIDDLKKDLDTNRLYDITSIMNEMLMAPVMVTESPSSFYDRTIHTGNPGMAAISQIESFHERMLKLPEFHTA